jgi:hypothetical protein
VIRTHLQIIASGEAMREAMEHAMRDARESLESNETLQANGPFLYESLYYPTFATRIPA